MQSDSQQQISTNPPLYKEVLVGILVGGMLGPLVGWFIGTFATFFAVAAMDTSQRLTIKDRKPFHGGSYEATIVCLYTGEPLLSFDDVRREIACASFGPYRQITAAYLLFRYDVELKACPIMELSLVA